MSSDKLRCYYLSLISYLKTYLHTKATVHSDNIINFTRYVAKNRYHIIVCEGSDACELVTRAIVAAISLNDLHQHLLSGAPSRIKPALRPQ